MTTELNKKKGVIIYVSSNKEHPDFEKRIRDNILAQNPGLPIISVTQKPIDFGTNICVGEDVGVSGFNMFRQVLIGMECSDADYVISCEADCLYPPDYFKFVPENLETCYRNDNVYVMGLRRDYFYHKPEGATHAQIVGRQFYIDTLKKLFEGAPMWSEEEKNFPKERTHKKKEDVFHVDNIKFFTTENPVVQIKTSRSMRYYTRSERVPVYELPYWGKGEDFRNKYYEVGEIH